MDQDDPMDFKSLMAKFQEDQTVLKQPRIKPSVPNKPKDLPPPTPPTSPTHFSLPAGARPSLLTSISLTSQGKTPLAPRVVFKEEKESKKPLLKTNSKKKTLGKDKGAKVKSEVGKQKEKKGGAAELVSATPSPKASVQKKKGFLTFRKSGKEGVSEPPSILDIPSPDDLSPELLVPTLSTFKEHVSVSPLSFSVASPPKQALVPGPLAPATPSLSVSAAAPSPSPVPTVPVVPTADIPDHPAPEVPALQIETPAGILQGLPAPPTTTPPRALPAPPVSPGCPPAVSPTPPVTRTPSPPVTPTPSPLPPPEFGDQSEAEEVDLDDPAVEEALPQLSPSPSPPPSPVIDPLSIPPPLTPPVLDPPPIPPSTPMVIDPPFIPPTPLPSAAHSSSVSPSPPVPVLDAPSIPSSPPPPVIDPPIIPPSPLPPVVNTLSIPPSPKVERPLSALSVLERVGQKAPARKSNLIDQRVLNALEKANREKTSPLITPFSSKPGTPTTEELPRLASTTPPRLELPPIDYNEQAKGAYPAPLKPAQVNGLDDTLHTSPGLEGVTEEGGNLLPEMMVVPPPPPWRILPEALSSTPTPEKITFHPPLRNSAPSEVFEEDSGLDVPEFDDGGGEAVELEASGLNASKALEGEVNGNGITTPEVDVPTTESQPLANLPQDSDLNPTSLNGQDIAGSQAESSPPGNGENVYEELTLSGKKKKGKSEATKKRKGPPKNPYAEAQQAATEQTPKTGWFAKSVKKNPPEGPGEKEQKKKEKQRLEKEKKEQKEKKEKKEKKEREQKEQKERQKKENEMKKQFKITGQEEAMYQAKVTVTSKGRKNDLAVTDGDIVSIIRTTNCPKGKWLARDSKGTCGYIAVSDVELDIKEMLELGKKTSQAVNKKNNNHLTEAEVTSMGDRTSNNVPLSTGSFTDESEEWSGDEDEPFSPAEYTDQNQEGHNRTLSMPEMGNAGLAVNHQHALSEPVTDVPNVQARHQALHKLSTFFHSPKVSIEPVVEQPAARPCERGARLCA